MKNNLTNPFAIIDKGSNSVRCMFVENGKRDKITISTRLGEGLSFSNELKKEAVDRTVKVVVDLYAQALRRGAKSVYAFATAAVRNSTNGNVFVNEVKNKIGLDVDVVSGDEEGNLALNGALNGKDGGVIDVGGASSEITYRLNGKKIYGYSLPWGAVKIFDAYGRDKQKISNALNDLTALYGQIPLGEYYAVGGTATSLASVDLALTEYDANKVNGHYISLNRLEELVNELFALNPTEIANKYCVGNRRAEIIAGGAHIILSIVKRANLKGVTVSENDNLEGYLLKLGGKL